jgi:hypothetical protein
MGADRHNATEKQKKPIIFQSDWLSAHYPFYCFLAAPTGGLQYVYSRLTHFIKWASYVPLFWVCPCAAGLGASVDGGITCKKELYAMNVNNMPNNRLRKGVFLRISSALMLLCALPMLLWCMHLIGNASLDYDYAGVGCFGMALVYAFSMVTSIAGLAFAGQPYRYGWCRVLAYIQLTAGVLLIFPSRAYSALTLPPVLLLTVLYLFSAGWQSKHSGEQQ